MGDLISPEALHRLTIAIVPALLAITGHEAAHAFVARYFGDNTAHNLGRTSFNPLVHIDPLGTVLLPMVTMLTGGFFFGWAKPVPVIASRLKNPSKDMPLVALAGPVANLIMALLWLVVQAVLMRAGMVGKDNFFYQMALMGVSFNVILFAFNMLPILPLDGGRVLMGLIPDRWERHFEPLERYGMFVVMGLAFMGGGLLYKLWISPIADVAYGLLQTLVSPVVALLRLF